MAGDRKISEAVQTLAGVTNFDNVKLVKCEVVLVDENKRTCNVTTSGGVVDFDINDVSLMASIDDGLLVIPTVGSDVIVCYNSKNVKYICQFSEINKVLIIIGDTTVEVKDGSIKFNDGSFDGLVKISDLTKKLNDMVTKINVELTKIQTGIATGGGSYTPTNLSNFNKSDYENTKITHG